METREWRFMDRSGWQPGLCEGEPDKMQWQDPATGLPCLAHRGPAGAWCGYVGVAEGHPLFEVPYSQETEVLSGGLAELMEKTDAQMTTARMIGCLGGKVAARPDTVFECHGGLTFSGFCGEHREDGRGVCHVPGEGEPERVWWFGFDCNHYRDIAPRRDFGWDGEGAYRDLAYVRSEVTELARQLAAVADA